MGVLGGSFDPVHNGHLNLASRVLERFHLDHVLFIPAYLSPHKQDSEPAPSPHRLAMLRLATASNPCFLVSEIELKRREVSFTIDTLNELLAEQPKNDYFLIMGMDAFENIHTWKAVNQLIESCHILVAARPGHSFEKTEEKLKDLFPDSPAPFQPSTREGEVTVFQHREKKTSLNFFDLPLVDISSSQIRERLNAKKEIKKLLPPEVENYIMQNQLYRAKSTP